MRFSETSYLPSKDAFQALSRVPAFWNQLSFYVFIPTGGWVLDAVSSHLLSNVHETGTIERLRCPLIRILGPSTIPGSFFGTTSTILR